MQDKEGGTGEGWSSVLINASQKNEMTILPVSANLDPKKGSKKNDLKRIS